MESHLPVILSTSALRLDTSTDTRVLMQFVVDAALQREIIEKDEHTRLQTLLCDCKVPIVSGNVHENIRAKAVLLEYEIDQKARLHVALEILMPCRGAPSSAKDETVAEQPVCSTCSLLWMPLPAKEFFEFGVPNDTYRHLHFGGFSALQPRTTKCYGHTYTYSGQTHPVESETPSGVQRLLTLTNAMFGLTGANRVNMDLENHYATGRHLISEHSDDERQFGPLNDVFCWTFGAAERSATFRVVSRHKEIDLPYRTMCRDANAAYKTRDVLTITLPSGLYVMVGREFQKHYTHEIPQFGANEFRKLLKLLKERSASGFPDFPLQVPKTEHGAAQETLVQADWIKRERERVYQLLIDLSDVAKRSGKRTKTSISTQSMPYWFEQWCKSRTSHTLRCFAEQSNDVSTAM